MYVCEKRVWCVCVCVYARARVRSFRESAKATVCVCVFKHECVWGGWRMYLCMPV